ncbi:MAG TPA: hypothetical protein VLA15_00875 [Desulfurivibrionaceae bacterium]|nr:hypothetical protein [Desulfurivibrionaceae bacterium]
MEKILPETLADLRKELELLMEFGAPAAERATLAALVDRYAADLIALKVFRSFYSYLPEAQDDGIVELRRIANHGGVFLLCAKSLLDNYLYLADREQAEFLGTLREGIWDPDILAFFGWPDREAFLKTVANPATLPPHRPVNEAPDLCPVCGTADGEPHTFGCPVEVCPWCEGQLTHCPCRFEKTGRKEFSQESHVDEFLELVERKGRIPFEALEQRPAFKDETD